jgi:hypothetical protein
MSTTVSILKITGFVSLFAALIALALVFSALIFWAYWLLASYVVDTGMGIGGFGGVALKVMFFFLIWAVIAAIGRIGKSAK